MHMATTLATMRPFRLLLAFCSWAAVFAASSSGKTGSGTGNDGSSSLSAAALSSGLLSKEFVQSAVDKEIRRTIINWAAESNSTKGQEARRLVLQDKEILFAATPNQRSLRRELEAKGKGEWDEVNLILSTLVINIPDTEINQPLLGFNLYARVNGTCSNIAIEDILLDYEKGTSSDPNAVSLAYKAQIIGAKLKCFIEIDWNTGVLDVSDHIKMRLVLNDNSVGVAAEAIGAPPTSIEFIGCKVVANIGDIQSTGGFSSNIINDLNYLLMDIVRGEVELISSEACDLITQFTGTVEELLFGALAVLDPFLVNFTAVDPLYLEKTVMTDVPLVDFTDTEGFGNVVNVLITNIASVIGADQINAIVGGFLNEDGVFVLELGSVPEDFANQTATHRALQSGDDILLEEEEERDCVAEAIAAVALDLPLRRRGRRLEEAFNDYLVNDYLKAVTPRDLQLDGLTSAIENITLSDIINTTDIVAINEITPTKITVAGLNNFSDAAPLAVIGKHTFLTELELPSLQVEAEVFVDVDVNGIPVRQLITAGAEISNIFINASIFVGLNELEVDQWTIGTFLNISGIQDCILSALVAGGVSQLIVTVEQIGVPIVTGVISDGVNDLINTGTEAIVCAYQDLITQAIPGFVQQNVTAIVNQFAECFIETEAANAVCASASLEDILGPPTDTEGDIEFDFRSAVYESDKVQDGKVHGYLDFRDLLLLPEDSKALGGSGRMPYGDLIHTAYNTLLSQIGGVDNETGLLEINSNLPESFALGMDLFATEFNTSDFDIVGSLVESVEVAAYDITAGNLNTLVTPLAFLQPTTKAHVLTNVFNWGPTAKRALNASVTMYNAIHGSRSFELSNEVDTAAKMDELDVSADFQVLISTRDFVSFPLRDVLELNCWLALMQEPEGVEGMENSFSITRLLLDMVDLSVNIKCLECTSKTLTGAIKILEDVGAMAVLGRRVGPLLEEVATSPVVPPLITSFIGMGDTAARRCPHQELYNTTSNETETGIDIQIPQLSNNSLDTVLFAGILGAEVLAVVFAETHVRASENYTYADPFSGQEALNLTGDPNLLDWYRLNESFIPIAGDGLELIRDFTGNSSGGAPGINDLATGFLAEDGSFNLSLGIAFTLQGYEIVVDQVKVYGLDTFTTFDILEPIAPQTLKNTIGMDNLTAIIDFSLDAINTTDPPQSYRISFDIDDVNATIYLFTAIDMDKVEALELGQLLFIENIIPCLLSTAFDVHVPALYVSVGNLSNPVVEGLQPDTSAAAAASLEAIFEAYAPLFVEATNYIFDGTVRVLINDFVKSFIEDSGSCLSTSELIVDTGSDLIDFRDLLLPPPAAVMLGGSGLEPYGDVVSTAYALVLDQVVASEEGELLGLNSFIESFTEGQSGEPGMFRLEDELFGFISEGPLPVDLLSWLNQTIELGAFDARIRNLNTLVSPMAVAYPTKHPHILENVVNFGPVNDTMINATLGLLLALQGDLSSLDMYNVFDLSGELSEIDVLAGLNLQILEEELFRFPLRDILELNCWLSLFDTANATELAAGKSGFKIETLLSKFASLSVGADCLNCTSRVLDDVISVVDATGASETFGNRLGYLLEDLATTDGLPQILGQFVDLGDEAGRSCPHHPLYNTTSDSANATELGDLLGTLEIPELSSISLDTILYAAIIFGEISVVIGADNHLQRPSEPTNPLTAQNALDVPPNAVLIDWTNPGESGIPFIAEALDFVRGFLGDTTETDDGGQDLGVNGLVAGFADENGVFELPLDGLAIEVAGLELAIQSIRAEGLDNFTHFDVLNAIAPQTFLNSFHLSRVKIGLDITIDVLETAEGPNTLNMTFDLEDVNVTVPLFAAVDQELLGDLKLGSLLHMANILPCLLNTTYGVQLEQLLVSVGKIHEPVFEGFLPDTQTAVENATRAVSEAYGEMIRESLPSVFDGTIRIMANGLISAFADFECVAYEEQNLTSRFVDFRQMFQPENSTEYSPYGDIIPMLKGILQEEFLSINPETQMPKINDAVIGPFTEDQSGVEGTLLLPGKLFGFETDALGDVGVGNVGIEVFDARVENLDTVGHPLLVLEPNMTRGDLLDNGATFGTQFNPLRFSIRGVLSLFGPIVTTRDEMDIFGELRSADIFAVILARIGAEEFLGFPMRHTSNIDCWLATLAGPALEELESGNTTVNPVLSAHFLSIAFRNMRVSAECFNCTTRGLDVVPDLLEILETTNSKNVLGYRNVELLLTLINSDFAQVWLLRFFQDSLQKCEYTQNATYADLFVPTPDFARLNAYDMETGVFTVTVMVQIGLVILAETIADLEEVVPVFPDPQPEIPPGTRLVDYTALDTYPLGSLAKTLVETISDFLGTVSALEIPGGSGEPQLGINVLTGGTLSTFSPDAPALDSFSFDEEIDIGFSGLTIRLKGATVSGFDTFNKFSIFNVTGPHTMINEFGWERLQLEFQLEVDLSGTPEFAERFLQNVDDDILEEESVYPFTLTLELADVLMVADTFLALDYELLNEVEIGMFLRTDYIFPCVQAAIRHLEFLDLGLSIGKVTKMQVSGWNSEDTATAAEALEEALIDEYGETIASMAPNVMSLGALPILNTAIQGFLRNSDVQCENFPIDPESDGFIDWRDMFLRAPQSIKFGGSGKEQYGNIIPLVKSFLNPVLSVGVLPQLEDGIKLDGALFDQGIRFDIRQFQSVMVLRISDIELQGIHVWVTPYDILEPMDQEKFRMENLLKIGRSRDRVNIKFRMYIAFKGLGEQLSEVDIENDFEVVLDMMRITVAFKLWLKVLEQSFLRFPVRDLLDVNCWLATVPAPELDDEGFLLPNANQTFTIEDLSLLLRETAVEINCFNCSSPGLIEWNTILQQPGVSDELTAELNLLIKDIIYRFGGIFLQDQINRLLVEAPKLCPHTDNLDPDAPAYQFSAQPVRATEELGYLTYLLAIVIPLLVALVLVIAVRIIVHRRHKRWLDSLPSERVFLIQQKQESEDNLEMELNELTKSMYESDEIPCTARYIVPFIVIINIGFFLSGHLSPGGRAMIDFTIAGEDFRVDNFYEFSIAQSTLDMWHAGGEELATLILLFSGIWPYTKQLITLALWFLPPSVVSVSRRGQFLLWLDILAKWSMIDIFVLLITVAGFRIGGASPNYSFFPPDFVVINLIVIPMWGLYANMIAQVMSQVSSHFIVMYHRRIIRNGKRRYRERHAQHEDKNEGAEQQDPAELLIASLNAEDQRDQLCAHGFIRIHKAEGARLAPRRIINFLLPVSALLLCGLLVVCCILPSLKLEAFGFVGFLIEFENRFQEEAVRYESIFTTAKILIDQAIYLGEWTHYIGNTVLVILFMTTLLVVPILSLLTLIYMWVYPLTRGRRERVAVFLEILQAWQYVEVYILGIVIESWQLGAISKLFINRYCESITPTLELIAGYGLFSGQDAQCFELAASIAGGAYLLIPFVFGLALIGTYVVKAYIQYLREVQDEEDDISEEEKLRAFDRTTWDNRENALDNIRKPPVLFTDTFRWTLRKDANAGVETLFASATPGAEDMDKPEGAATMPVADTSSSEEANEEKIPLREVPAGDESEGSKELAL